MCGENAQSIAAPPILMPSKDRVLDKVPCPETDSSQWGRAPADSPRAPALMLDDGPLRAFPPSFSLPRPARVRRIVLDTDLLAAAAGIVSSIDRPPRVG